MKVAYIGYGVFGKHLKWFVDGLFSVKQEIFFEDATGFPLQSYKDPAYKDFTFLLAIGYKHLAFRSSIIADLLELDRKILTIVHPTAHVANSAKIEQGCIIFPMSNIDEECVVGHGTIIHNSVSLSHNTTLGMCNYLSPGAIICGNCEIGSNNFIGAGSIIGNGITIGHNCTIGMASAVQQSLPDHTNAIGNPLKILSTSLTIL